MELTARRAERSADERCPYCHDALAPSLNTSAEDLVACPGCATHHHRACVEELGRCTIRGCERPLVPEPEHDPVAGRLRRSSVTEEIRRRVRARARTFMAAHCAPVPVREPVFRDRSGEKLRVGDVATLLPRTPFEEELAAALEAFKTAWIHERPALCRRIAELLRSSDAARFEDAEAVAARHAQRAVELDAVVARVRANPGPSLPALVLFITFAATFSLFAIWLVWR